MYRLTAVSLSILMAAALPAAAKTGNVSPEAKAEDSQAPRRPLIGLALGGGGARGAAHVGVLKALERLHVPVDFVAGTSMGAVIGGLYAAGIPVDRIEAELRTRDWSDLLSDRNPYKDLVWRRKQDEGRYLLDLEIGFRDGRFRMPTGLRAGQKLGFELQAVLLPVAGVHDFSRLPVPFRAIATDVETGERVILDNGDLSEAILASMTVPGVFAPVEIGGRLLVDGGMADNLPVDVVRGMGADIVIAVDVGTPLATRDSISSFVGVTSQAFTFLTRKNSEASAARADLIIRPDLEGVSSGDFGSLAGTIPIGEEAAEAIRARLDPLALDEEAWREYSVNRGSSPVVPFPLSTIRVEGNQRIDERVILGRAGLEPEDIADVPTLRGALRRIYGTSDFQRVRFDLGSEGDPRSLTLRVREKSWGPTYFHFGIEAVDDLEGGAFYAVKMNMTRSALNPLGGEWRNDFQLGSSPSLRTEIYQPLDFRGRFFVAPWLAIQKSRTPIYEDRSRIASYGVNAGHTEVDIGAEYGRFGELRLGVYRGHVRARVDTGSADLPRFDLDTGGLALDASFETFDRPAIPHTGSALRVRALFSRPGLGAADSYDRIEAGASKFIGLGRSTLFGIASYGTDLGSDIPIYDEFTIGGLFSLGGYSEGELRGQRAAAAKIGYHYRLLSLPPGFGEGLYAGGLVETASVWNSRRTIDVSDIRYGVTVILGAETILGPVFLAYGRADGGRDRFYLTVGRTL